MAIHVTEQLTCELLPAAFPAPKLPLQILQLNTPPAVALVDRADQLPRVGLGDVSAFADYPKALFLANEAVQRGDWLPTHAAKSTARASRRKDLCSFFVLL